MTEAEAREKWCPHVRAVLIDKQNDDVGIAAHNTMFDEDAKQHFAGHCIASSCMMWEWDEGKAAIGKPPDIGDCGLKRRAK